jgi:hypothetical protein
MSVSGYFAAVAVMEMLFRGLSRRPVLSNDKVINQEQIPGRIVALAGLFSQSPNPHARPELSFTLCGMAYYSAFGAY